MSKIKDLYAEVNDIDDLKPVGRKQEIKMILLDKADRFLNIDDWLYEWAEWGVSYDEAGHQEWDVDNFDHLCDVAATDLVDGYIEDQHYDMDDDMYSELIDEIGDELIKRWDKFRPILVKRMLDDREEEWAQHQEYNRLTLEK